MWRSYRTKTHTHTPSFCHISSPFVFAISPSWCIVFMAHLDNHWRTVIGVCMRVRAYTIHTSRCLLFLNHFISMIYYYYCCAWICFVHGKQIQLMAAHIVFVNIEWKIKIHNQIQANGNSAYSEMSFAVVKPQQLIGNNRCISILVEHFNENFLFAINFIVVFMFHSEIWRWLFMKAFRMNFQSKMTFNVFNSPDKLLPNRDASHKFMARNLAKISAFH